MWVTGEYYDGFRAVELAARGRLDAPAQSDPLLRLDGFRRVHEQQFAGDRPLVVRARSGPSEAWLFLLRAGGNRLAAMAGEHTARFAPVFAGDPDDRMKRALLRAMARRLAQFRIARVALGPMLPEHAALIRQAFGHAGWSIAERAGPASFTLSAGGRHFEEYWDHCPGRLHEQVAAGSRHLNVEVADLLTPRLWDEVALIAGGADTYLRELAQDATLDRTLRLGVARVGDAPVAAQLWTMEQGRAVSHWRAEDREARHLFPSAQLTASVLRYLMNVDHAQLIELGNGREAELADWADERRVLRRLDLFNRKAPSAWAPALAASAAALVRRAPLD